MYLYWFKGNKGITNFGDELNPYILECLTGKKVNYLPIADTKINRLLKLLKRTLLNQMSFNDIVSVLRSLTTRKYYAAIGSILQAVNGKNCHVWGAGLINKNSAIGNCKFYAVRGEISRNYIKKLGYKTPKAIGDPALLLPMIYKSSSKKIYDLGIIPHYVQMEDLKKQINLENNNVLIIDLLNEPELVIDQINSCKRTISSSLHGIIVSHAYGIPSLWCNLGKTPLHGDDIKFYDYFSSVDINFYSKIELDFKNNLIYQVNSLFTEFYKDSLINNSLKNIQSNLIKNAPFEILEKYKSDSLYKEE